MPDRVPEMPALAQELLGYLNFSSGTSDPKFLRNLNALFGLVEADASLGQDPLASIATILTARLDELAGQTAAFADHQQAREVLRLALVEFPPRYRQFHRDLLYHQRDADIWRPLMLGRVFEAILSQGGPWEDGERIVEGAIGTLNDYIGHRPVAVLRTAQRIEPYDHEWIRPVPLYARGAGVAVGRYRAVVEQALEILRATDPALLREAYFDPEMLDELAFDPRAYDFDHPVNKRPNYHFGQWDPRHIDGQGRYRRFVVQQVTLDVLLERVTDSGDLPREEVLQEAAAVLAGTILMASGTSGSGPDAHDSTTTLTTLLPRIAAYRDAFYERFVSTIDGAHGERLRAEAVAGKQPLAGARQHLNQQLARRRAAQLEHVHLALLFARMGFPEASHRQASIVAVAGPRMICEIHCRLTTGHLSIDAGQFEHASVMLHEIEDFLQRAIQCGALVDPWNILGFQGQFSLFPSPENSVPDHRVDQLIEVMQQIFGLYARLWSEAAAHQLTDLEHSLAERMGKLARWWDQYASTTVEGIEGFSGGETHDSARQVAEALEAFHLAGAAAGDIAFWRKRVAHFNSSKAYALVVTALLRQPDLVAAMALLMQWLSQAGQIPLKQGDHSFHVLAQRWLRDVCSVEEASGLAAERQKLARKFFELLEANAEDYWQVPSLDLLGMGHETLLDDDLDDDDDEQDDDDEDDDDGLYSAAYDEVVYIDSTGDGVESDMLESGLGPATDFELEQEARRIGERLAFLRTVATMWKSAVLAYGPGSDTPLPDEVLSRWLEQAEENQRRLLSLLEAVDRRRIPPPTADRESLLEFDRRRGVKEMLVDKIVGTNIETADAARSMRAALPGTAPEGTQVVDDVLRAVLRGDTAEVQRWWPHLLEVLRLQSLLYVPPSKGGDPARMTEARVLQQAVRDLLEWLPRLGLLRETCQLIEAARLMESANPVGAGAISEFDRLFATGYEAIVDALVVMSQEWTADENDVEARDNELVECLEQVTESLLKQWLAHSRTLRLSVLERIADEKGWQSLVKFIERYGRDLFTQRFLNLGNLRAILHQGVDAWISRLEEQRDTRDEDEFQLIVELGEKISRADAVKHLGLVIEAVVENYSEYRDYNSTTTQSDRGDLLYTLLDFLRLRVHYDRVAWHLKPVITAHAVLVRRGCHSAAETWRRALAERTGELADTLQARGAELRKKYAMRLPTVTDRLAERFVRPLDIDRVRAMIKPAMQVLRQRSTTTPSGTEALVALEREIDELTHEPTGVGLDVPAWLASLEQEVESQLRLAEHPERSDPLRLPLAQVKLPSDEVHAQLAGWERHPH